MEGDAPVKVGAVGDGGWGGTSCLPLQIENGVGMKGSFSVHFAASTVVGFALKVQCVEFGLINAFYIGKNLT